MDNSEQKDLVEDLLHDEELMRLLTEEPEDESAEQIVTDSPDRIDNQSSVQKTILLYLHDFAYLLAALIVVSLLLLRVVVVSGTSMNRTLLDGDYLFVLSNTIYQQPRHGDIVVVCKESFDNGAPIVKRVIAVEGQTVDIDFERGIVYVDGVAIDEPYVNTPTNMNGGMRFPLTVDEGCIFVLGDNRNVSRDSRYTEIGQVREEEVLGKVVFLFLPGTNGEDIYGDPKEPRDWTRIGVIK